jgi:serine/threonine protein kinase
MAEIYLAKATGISGFEKYVALKVIHPNYSQDAHFIEMLVEEAKIVVHLTQPNIVQIFDLGRIDDVRYIAMEYVDGPDLYHIMRTITSVGEHVDFDVAAFIALETCAALDYAHRCTDQVGQPLRIIHRDVSPQNIIVSRAGEVKLADFGIAKATVRARQTAVGVIKGKYYYMSPEQAWGDTIDHRTDLFSTAVVLYEVIVGQMLYLEEDLGALLDKVRKAEIAPPSRLRPGVPPALERIVMKGLARRPADRFQSAYDFQTALTQFLFSHCPNFTVGRLRTLIDRVVNIQEQRNADVVDDAGVALGASNLGQDSLMDQSEFRPLTTHSILSMDIDLDQSTEPIHDLPAYDSYDDDETLISDPPMMDSLSGPAPVLPVLASVPGVRRMEPEPGILVGVPVEMPMLASDPGGPGALVTNEWDELGDPTTVQLGRRGGQTEPDRPAQSGQPPLPVAQPGVAPVAQPGVAPVAQPGVAPVAQPGMAPVAQPVQWGQPPEVVVSPAAPGVAGYPPVGQGGAGQPALPYGAAPVGTPQSAVGAGYVPAPTYQPVFAPATGNSELESDAVEQMLQRSRSQRHFIVVGLLVCLVLIGVAIFIITARTVTAETASVRVITDPPGAKVYYRGKYVGKTPHRLDSLTLDEVHWVRLESVRCESRAVKLNVEAGKTKTLRVKLLNCEKQH